jgi:flagellar motor switch protein FliM
LRCGGVQLFRGHMGRRGGHIAVQIQDRLMK